MKDRMLEYQKRLSRMIPESQQYKDQAKRIQNFKRMGHIALGKDE